MTLAPFEVETDAPTATTRVPVRPVFVDDGGRRKLVLVRAGYLALAVFVGYLVVIAVNLTVLPSGSLGRSVAAPAGVAAPPPRFPLLQQLRPTAVVAPSPATVDRIVAPTPAAVAQLALAVRPAPRVSAARPPTSTPRAATTTTRPAPTSAKKPVASSAPPAPVTAPPPAVAQPPTPAARPREQ